jgi:putative phosphoesterase
MTRIGIISDTHVRESGSRRIPQRVFEAFRDVDLILHGGDLTAPRVLEDLGALAKVLAVQGNNDRSWPGVLPISRRVEVEQVVIGLVHGDLPATGRPRPKPLDDAPGNRETGANAVSHFEFDDDVGVFVFGHSHRPFLQDREISGRVVLLLNPGSPTDKRYAPNFGVAVLKVDGAQCDAELILW